MQLTYHIGKCCGIKTVFGFQEDPDWEEERIERDTSNPDKDQFGYDVSTDDVFFRSDEDVPVESGADRLKRYVEYVDKVRPQGILEVVLARHPDALTFEQEYDEDGYDLHEEPLDQVTLWEPVLADLGFKMVSSCINSNTENEIFVYHRYSVSKEVSNAQPLRELINDMQV